MSREQLNEQQAQHDVAAPNANANANGDIQGLPPRLYGLVMQLRPGDVQGLHQLLSLYGEGQLGRAILAVASSHVGLSTVKRAEALMSQHAQGRGGTLSSEEVHEGGAFAIESGAPAAAAPEAAPAAAQPEAVAPAPTIQEPENKRESQVAMLATDTDQLPLRDGVRAQVLALQPGDAWKLKELLNLYPQMSDGILLLAREHLGPETVGEAAKLGQHHAHGQPSEEGKQAAQHGVDNDDSGARKYNDAHPALVAEFNELTQNLCCGSETDASGPLDPTKVSRWQAQHGLHADGKVGPQTVAAARKAKGAAGSVASTESAASGIDV